jgi:hypothetical protein
VELAALLVERTQSRRCWWKMSAKAIAAFARRVGYELVAEYYDRAVRGADAFDARPGFAAMLEHIAGNGARTIIVETANRFARDLIVQETGHRMLKGKGIEIIAADSPTAFVDDTSTATFVRQVLGAVAQLDKAMTVAKLRGLVSANGGRMAGARVDRPCTFASPNLYAAPNGCTESIRRITRQIRAPSRQALKPRQPLRGVRMPPSIPLQPGQ